jgi:hypothetical protein
MTSLQNHRFLTKVNFIIVGFFILLTLIDYYRIDSAVISIFRELLTIPFLALQIIFLILSIRFVFKHNAKDFWLNISIFVLAICNTVTICSFCNF